MRKLHLLAAVALLPLSLLLGHNLSVVMDAEAQNTQCSNRSVGDTTNACANTRFVQGAVTPVSAIVSQIQFNVSNAVFAPTQIQLNSGRILIGTASNVANAQLMSGSCTITNAGVITCPASGVTQISAGSGITLTPSPITGTGSVAVSSDVTRTIASGTSALGTGAISSASCATVVTTTATGTATTDTVTASFNSDPTAVTGYVPLTTGMLTIIVYPTANNVNFKVCNNTTGSITPGPITLNWRVVR